MAFPQFTKIMKFKTQKLLAGCLAFAAFANANEQDEPLSATPSGFVKAAESIVREGLPVRLDWNVIVPIVDTEEIFPDDPDKEIIPNFDVLAEVRVLGAALGNSRDPMWAEARMKGSKGGWRVIFDDYANGVGAGSSEVFEVKEGEKLEFWSVTWDGSQPSRRNAREDWRQRNPVQTGTGDDRLFLLRDGDKIPGFNPAFDQQNIDAFLAPYLREDGQTLKLGPRDLLILTELNNRINSSADYQDMVVLVTFTKTELK